MVSMCHFILPNGRRCQCVPRADERFCRHHMPAQPKAVRRSPAIYTRFVYWRDLDRNVSALEPNEIPREILNILWALLQGNSISDRNAGRLLRSLLRRFGTVPFTLPASNTPEDPDDNPLPGVDGRAFARLLAILEHYVPYFPPPPEAYPNPSNPLPMREWLYGSDARSPR